MINYGIVKIVDLDFHTAVNRVTEALQKHGFGVISKIDLRDKFKEKLGIDYRNYVILGACNPKKAFEALAAEDNLGLLLPCNVIVYEKDGKTVVAAVRPTITLKQVKNDQLDNIAKEVEASFESIIKAL